MVSDPQIMGKMLATCAEIVHVSLHFSWPSLEPSPIKEVISPHVKSTLEFSELLMRLLRKTSLESHLG